MEHIHVQTSDVISLYEKEALSATLCPASQYLVAP